MRSKSYFIVFALLTLIANRALAGGFSYPLPADGKWVKYKVTMKMFAPMDFSSEGTQVIRSVGRKIVDGRPCRWIESELRIGRQYHLYKVLVHEKDFGKNLLSKVEDGWSLTKKDGTPRRIKKNTNMSVFTIMWRAPFGTPAAEVTKLRVGKTITCKQGKLKCEQGSQASFVHQSDISIGTIKFRAWKHQRVPFAFAAYQIDIQQKPGKKAVNRVNVSITFASDVSEFGSNAKSALPDKK